jgi:hypothetical protein
MAEQHGLKIGFLPRVVNAGDLHHVELPQMAVQFVHARRRRPEHPRPTIADEAQQTLSAIVDAEADEEGSGIDRLDVGALEIERPPVKPDRGEFPRQIVEQRAIDYREALGRKAGDLL